MRKLIRSAIVVLVIFLVGGPDLRALAAPGRGRSGGAGARAPSAGRTPGRAPRSSRTGRQVIVGRTPRTFILVPDFVPFYYPWASFGFYWGWPYYPPYGYPYRSPIYSSDYGNLEVEYLGNETALETHIHPRKAKVRVDGEVVGEARDYNDWSDPLHLKPGDHVVELEAEGFRTLRIKLHVQRGYYYTLHYRLKHGEGVDSRSPLEPPDEDAV